MNTTEFKSTELGKSYWNGTGAFQKEYDELYKQHVPSSGAASTLNGELIRAISRLFYEYCNNGNCNACEQKWGEEEYTCGCCNGSGVMMGEDDDGNEIEVDCDTCYGFGTESEEVIESTSVAPFYVQFLELIEKSVPSAKEDVKKVENFIEADLYNSSTQFSDENMKIYNALCDKVIFHVLTNEDKELPSWYAIY